MPSALETKLFINLLPKSVDILKCSLLNMYNNVLYLFLGGGWSYWQYHGNISSHWLSFPLSPVEVKYPVKLTHDKDFQKALKILGFGLCLYSMDTAGSEEELVSLSHFSMYTCKLSKICFVASVPKPCRRRIRSLLFAC
jgi:hypothetical protein